jgi:hypothetical protein
MLAPTADARREFQPVRGVTLGSVKSSPLLVIALVAVVGLIVLGSFVHVLGGITKILVLVVVVLAAVIGIRNYFLRRAKS